MVDQLIFGHNDLRDARALDEPGTHRLLRTLAVILLVACAMLAAYQCVTPPYWPRPGVFVMLAIGTAMLALTNADRNALAAHVLCWGLVAAGLIGAMAGLGLLHPTLTVLPVASMTAAWFLGRRASLGVALASGAGLLGIVWMDGQVGASAAGPAREAALLAIELAILVGATLMGQAVARAYRHQIERVGTSQAQLTALMDSTLDPIWSVDPDSFGLLTFNRVLRDWFADRHGIAVAQGMRPEDLLADPQVVRAWRRLYERALAEDGFTCDDFSIDEQTALQLRVCVMRSAGRAIGISVFGRNVTAERLSQRELEQQHSLRQKLIESIPGAFYLLDAEGRYLLWNQNLEQFLGLSADEIRRLPPYHAIAEEDRTRAADAVDRALTTGEASHLEACAVMADGQRVPMFFSAHPFEWQGRPAVLGIGVNIAQRKAAEAELERHRTHLAELVESRTHELSVAKDAAESAARAKSAFLANMSHEIRTPLNAITGLARLMRRAPQPPEQRTRLAQLETAAAHLLEIINAILDLSKIDAGKMLLEHAPLRLQDVVRDVAIMVSDRAGSKGLRLDTAAPTEPLDVIGDATRLRQALLNYATNAVKFTESGSVTLRVAPVAENDDGLLVRFEVEDTGIGIDPDVVSRLFDAFEQADTSITRTHGGTGLGLAITRKIAQLMDGETGVESVPGQGSRFWFTARLPRGEARSTAPDDGTAALAEATLRIAHAGRRILLVEDEPVSCDIARSVLEEVGLIVDVATDGAEALALGTGKDYDAILMDMRMPVMDGLEVTRLIRQDPARGRVPIIAMTANAFNEDRERCLEAGMNDFVSKPVNHDVLYATLARWLTRDAG